MKLTLFDLDNTLLNGDSDHAWGQYLAEEDIVDRNIYARENERFFQAYRAGKLDIFEYLNFCLKPLATHSIEELNIWHAEFMQKKILPMITQEARNLVEEHRKEGDMLAIITSTNSFVTGPIAAEFGIEHLIATEPEIKNGRYTGKIVGKPCYGIGKLENLRVWLINQRKHFLHTRFYTDSYTDLPLMEWVDEPIAVNPDEKLKTHAEENGWPILRLA